MFTWGARFTLDLDDVFPTSLMAGPLDGSLQQVEAHPASLYVGHLTPVEPPEACTYYGQQKESGYGKYKCKTTFHNVL